MIRAALKASSGHTIAVALFGLALLIAAAAQSVPAALVLVIAGLGGYYHGRTRAEYGRARDDAESAFNRARAWRS